MLIVEIDSVVHHTSISDCRADAARQDRLEALGFMVDLIVEIEGKRQPDLVARADGATTYVEVKTRIEDRVLRAKMESAPTKATTEILTPLDKHNSISAEIKHASSQLGTLASPTDYRLLWYRADSGPFVHDTSEQVIATLYGMRMVLVDSASGRQPRYCAYAGHADFYRFRDIDGAILEVDGLITLFLNPFSPRRVGFAASRIAAVVNPSVFDVEQAGANGKLFLADGDAPRHSDDELLRHLAAKYRQFSFARFLELRFRTPPDTASAHRWRGGAAESHRCFPKPSASTAWANSRGAGCRPAWRRRRRLSSSLWPAALR